MMKKFAAVLGVAAVATITGCKDPNYNHGNPSGEPKLANPDTEVVATPAPENQQAKPEIEIIPEEKHCTCAPGTKHTEPCTCGAPDCMCVVVVKPAAPAPAPVAETTPYTVQKGDCLSKISKRFNVTIAAIMRTNNLKSDKLRIGQKLQIPGKHEIVAAAPAPVAAAKPQTVAKGFAPYTGATKEYVVKNGDTLGAIAYSNGINIRQLKALNSLTSDNLRIGQKLKIPADGKGMNRPSAKTNAGKAQNKKPDTPKPQVSETIPETDPVSAPADTVSDPVDPVSAPAETAVPAEAAAPVAAAPVAEPKAETVDYVVKEGEDILNISIQFGVPSATIRELNNLAEDAQVKAGDVLKLPAEVQQ